MSVEVVEAKPTESTPWAMRSLYGVPPMISLLTWFGLKSPVMPANRYTSDSPTVLENVTESPTSRGMARSTALFASVLLCTYNSFRLQVFDLPSPVAQLGEYLLRVLSEFGGQDAQRRRLAVVADRVGEHSHLASPRVLESHYRLIVDYLRILLDILVVVYRREPDADLIEHPKPVLRRSRPDVSRYVGVHLFPSAELILLGPLVKGIVPERLGQLLRRRKRDADVAVGRLEDAVGCLVEPRGDARLAAVVQLSVEVVDERFDLQVQRRVQQVAVDSFPLTRVPPFVEGGKDAQSSEHRRMLVDDRGADQSRRVALAAVDRRQAAHCLAQEVLARPVSVRAVRAVPREGAVYEVGLLLGDLLVAEAQTLHSARPVVLDDDVGIADQTPHDLLPPRGAQVHAQAALVAPAEEEEDANPVQISLSPRPVSLPGPLCRLNLDNVGPEVGQDLDGGGALQKVCEAEDLYPVQHRLYGPFREWPANRGEHTSYTSTSSPVPGAPSKRGSRFSKKAVIPSSQSSLLKTWSLRSSVSLPEYRAVVFRAQEKSRPMHFTERFGPMNHQGSKHRPLVSHCIPRPNLKPVESEAGVCNANCSSRVSRGLRRVAPCARLAVWLLSRRAGSSPSPGRRCAGVGDGRGPRRSCPGWPAPPSSCCARRGTARRRSPAPRGRPWRPPYGLPPGRRGLWPRTSPRADRL